MVKAIKLVPASLHLQSVGVLMVLEFRGHQSTRKTPNLEDQGKIFLFLWHLPLCLLESRVATISIAI
jgi:hypothetical protein